jgi:hypothetical protein
MIRAVFGIFALGGVLCYIGYTEHKLSKNTSETPVPTNLVQLEYGVDPPNNHIEIGEHVAVYDALVYCIRQGKYEHGEPGPNKPVEYTYYPVISMSHPFVKSMKDLGDKDYDQLTPEEQDQLTLKDFKVIVRTCRFDTVGDLPESFATEEKVTGMIVNEISSLGYQERNLITETFPGLDTDKLLILQENRKPSSASFSSGMMLGGGFLMVIGGVLLFTSCKFG